MFYLKDISANNYTTLAFLYPLIFKIILYSFSSCFPTNLFMLRLFLHAKLEFKENLSSSNNDQIEIRMHAFAFHKDLFFFFYMSLYSYNNLLLDKKSNYANTKTVICKELIKPFDEKVYDHEHTKYQNIYVYIGYTGRHLVCVHLRRIHFQFHRDLFSIEINSITDLLISVETS